MAPGILGKKVGMTQVFRPDGRVVPVTALKVGPCVVVQRKTLAKDGYDAVQLGLVEFVKPNRVKRPMAGHFKKADVEPARFLRELRLGSSNTEGDLKTGDRVLAEEFKVAEKVDVIGNSKGRGFQGVVKRHGYSGGPATHGSMSHKVPGSIGQSSYPSRVFKGTRLPGRMGNSRVTARNLEIVEVNVDDNVILVKGAVPGPSGGYVIVRRTRI
jgi:large subunit ribosomal protein L3